MLRLERFSPASASWNVDGERKMGNATVRRRRAAGQICHVGDVGRSHDPRVVDGHVHEQLVELDKLFMDVAVYNARIMGPTHVANVADLACRTAPAYRGVAHLTFPVDIPRR